MFGVGGLWKYYWCVTTLTLTRKYIVTCHLPRAPSYGGVRTWVEGSQMRGGHALAGASNLLGYKWDLHGFELAWTCANDPCPVQPVQIPGGIRAGWSGRFHLILPRHIGLKRAVWAGPAPLKSCSNPGQIPYVAQTVTLRPGRPGWPAQIPAGLAIWVTWRHPPLGVPRVVWNH